MECNVNGVQRECLVQCQCIVQSGYKESSLAKFLSFCRISGAGAVTWHHVHIHGA